MLECGKCGLFANVLGVAFMSLQVHLSHFQYQMGTRRLGQSSSVHAYQLSGMLSFLSVCEPSGSREKLQIPQGCVF